MNVRQRKKWMHTAAAAIVVCAMIVLAGGLLSPTDVAIEAANVPAPGSSAAPARPHAAMNSSDAKVALQPLLVLCRRNWRQSLDGDTTAGPAAADSAAAPAAQQVFQNLRLVGTAIETDHSMAMFQKPDNSLAVCAEGGRIENGPSPITVVRIAGRTVTVRSGAQTQTLALPPSPEIPQ